MRVSGSRLFSERMPGSFRNWVPELKSMRSFPLPWEVIFRVVAGKPKAISETTGAPPEALDTWWVDGFVDGVEAMGLERFAGNKLMVCSILKWLRHAHKRCAHTLANTHCGWSCTLSCLTHTSSMMTTYSTVDGSIHLYVFYTQGVLKTPTA